MISEVPRDGDILVSNPTATLAHEIGIVPNTPHLTCINHDLAVERARQLASELGVDAWLTEDHCHFLRIGSYRAAPRGADGGAPRA